MKTPVEEIISKYIDDLNAGTVKPIDVFLAQFPDLPPRLVTGLRKILMTLIALRNQSSDEEPERAGWRRIAGSMRSGDENDEEAIRSIAASTASPTVGEYLSWTLAENPATLKKFTIPQEVLLTIVQDDSPLEVVQRSPKERFRFAQRYALQDQSLVGQIGGLLAHLSRLWLSGTMRPSGSPSFTRPAPQEPSSN